MSLSKKVLVRILPATAMEVAKGDWIIGPVGHHRDSDELEEANFHYVVDEMAALEPDYHDHEVLGWNHWAVGWIEEMAYRPGSGCAAFADDCRDRLENYPVLSEEYLAAVEAEVGEDDETPDPPEVEGAETEEIDNPWLDQGGES